MDWLFVCVHVMLYRRALICCCFQFVISQFWKDVGSLNEQDVADATPEDEKEVGRLVTEVSQMDDDLVTPDKEKKVPLEYSKLSEELGELKGEGEI